MCFVIHVVCVLRLDCVSFVGRSGGLAVKVAVGVVVAMFFLWLDFWSMLYYLTTMEVLV